MFAVSAHATSKERPPAPARDTSRGASSAAAQVVEVTTAPGRWPAHALRRMLDISGADGKGLNRDDSRIVTLHGVHLHACKFTQRVDGTPDGVRTASREALPVGPAAPCCAASLYAACGLACPAAAPSRSGPPRHVTSRRRGGRPAVSYRIPHVVHTTHTCPRPRPRPHRPSPLWLYTCGAQAGATAPCLD